ncbi:hypothetical protein [Rhodopila sp.]|uniref:hypothetical protein n=1 Tax=Rhodopila sp. TaxID=2480087 RepID=UPI003D132B5D
MPGQDTEAYLQQQHDLIGKLVKMILLQPLVQSRLINGDLALCNGEGGWRILKHVMSQARRLALKQFPINGCGWMAGTRASHDEAVRGDQKPR